MKIEYRVREKTTYYITRYEEDERGASSQNLGEHNGFHAACRVAHALGKAEHERLGWPIDDERISYPEQPDMTDASSQIIA